MELRIPKEGNNKNYSKKPSIKDDINRNKQKDFLIKYHKLFGDSLNDVELLDIFEKHNYNETKIIKDINALLSINNEIHYYEKNDNDNYNENNNIRNNHSPSFGRNFNSRSNTLKNRKENYICESDIPSDYPPPPKNEEYININSINSNTLLKYKKFLFKELKRKNNTLKIRNYKKDEINFDDVKINKTEYYSNQDKDKDKETQLIGLYKKNDIRPKYQSIKRNNKNNEINISKEQKKKYMQYFFRNIKNYSRNLYNNKNDKKGKSPDFGRNNIVNLSPDNSDYSEKKVLTYKKGMKNYYLSKRSSFSYLKISYKINDIFIPACYENPQRDQLLKMINEKKHQNPDKIIEIIFPQIPPMGAIPFYSNLYPTYNQYNPYMNMYMYMPSPIIQYPLQNSYNCEIMTNKLQNSNNIEISQNLNNNITSNANGQESTNPLNNNEIIQLNKNLINNQSKNNSSQNSLLMNNIGSLNYYNHKSSGNISNSGNVNTTSSFK